MKIIQVEHSNKFVRSFFSLVLVSDPSTDTFFLVNRKLGEGAFATVYSIRRAMNNEDEMDSSEPPLAIKASESSLALRDLCQTVIIVSKGQSS